MQNPYTAPAPNPHLGLNPSAPVKTLQVTSSICMALAFGYLGGRVAAFAFRAEFQGNKIIPLIVFLIVGTILMAFLHKEYQRMRVLQIVLLTLAVIALLPSPFMIKAGQDGLKRLAIEEEIYKTEDVDGPPPDFMGWSSGIDRSLIWIGYTLLITGALVIASCLFGLAGRRTLAKEAMLSAMRQTRAH